mgnify:CR=1 FL=1|jgi:hypothetical protein
MPYDYVEVEWLDIVSTAGWEKSEDTKLAVFWSYGFLINHDKEEVRIAVCKDEEGEWFGFTIIPAGCVKKITSLTEGVSSLESCSGLVLNEYNNKTG